jgi:tetratricopeptide (TPR) repeat protein
MKSMPRLLLSLLLILACGWTDQGAILCQAGKYDEAIGYYQKQWQENPSSTSITEKLKDCEKLREAERTFVRGEYLLADQLYDEIPSDLVSPNRRLVIGEAAALTNSLRYAHQSGSYPKVKRITARLLSLNPSDNRLTEYNTFIQTLPAQQKKVYDLINSDQHRAAYQKLQEMWVADPSNPDLRSYIEKTTTALDKVVSVNALNQPRGE